VRAHFPRAGVGSGQTKGRPTDRLAGYKLGARLTGYVDRTKELG